jgi:hypothetical protein
MDIIQKKGKYVKPKLKIYGNLKNITKAKLGPGEDALHKLSR